MELAAKILSDLTVFMKYARFLSEKGRRETWSEMVTRNKEMHQRKYPHLHDEIEQAYKFVYDKKVLPSMRALSNDTAIMTKEGWKTVGKIKIGDILYDSKGKETKVLETYKFEDIDLFNIVFSDGSNLVACEEHQWIVSTLDDLKYKKEPRVVTTGYIKEHIKQGDRHNISIKNPLPIEREEQDLHIDPYVLGLWLGDGYSSGYQFSTSLEDSKFMSESYEKCGYSAKQSVSSNIWTWSCRGLKKDLDKYNLSNNKHIPKVYLFGSIEQRLSLVQGLMDSDGCVEDSGRCHFTNGNRRIIDGFLELLSSLGIKYIISNRPPRSPKHQALTEVSFFTGLPVCRLPRKKEKLRNFKSQRTDSRKVFSVEKIGKGSATCFLVDSEDHSFLAGRHMIPTHNCLQFSGKPIEINPSRQYNCSFVAVDHPDVFSEIMFLLLGGVGVGFSVQKHHIEKLPSIRKPQPDRPYGTRRFLVGDSIEGWADSIKALMMSFFKGGADVAFDFREIRPKGAKLITSGGKAPGPEPLKICLRQIKSILNEKQDGDQLQPIEVHDIICHIADAVLAGGIRRAALISLFSADDREMLAAKTGNWYETHPQRGRANNSATLVRHRLNKKTFFNIWERIEASGAGEPGIYLTNDAEIGTNPCKPLKSKILTPSGYITFEDALKLNSLEVVLPNGRIARASKPFKTGENRQVYKVKLSNGTYIYGTENHLHKTADGKWVRVDELRLGDRLEYTTHQTSPFSEHKQTLLQIQNDKGLYRKKKYEKVISVEKDGIEDVYDIEVYDESHSFIDSGITAHNCAEISLKSAGLCNLTEINTADIESQEDFNQRAVAAAFIGTLQAGYTDFHYLRPIWKKNAEKEALLGVSLTGIAAGSAQKYNLQEVAELVNKTNEEVAKKIGIRKAARCTTIKPSGTSSLVLGCSSGIHAYHAPYYLRRIRVGKNEDIYHYLSINHEQLVEDEFFRPDQQAVITIPQKAPAGAILRTEDALDLLERVKHFYSNWITPGHREGSNTHNISATISIKKDEWQKVGEWMWKNRDYYNGLSVLPYDENEHTYIQSPFEECTEEKYNELFQHLNEVDLTKVMEIDDNTNLTGELACAGGKCEIA